MKKIVVVFMVVTLFTFSLASSALAATSQSSPAGSCPNNFELMEFMDHSDHPHHIGVTVDLNGDGWICMKHVPNTELHLHVDNSLPLR